MTHHREADRQCPMLCDDPANTYLVALDIALDGERISVSCPECGRTLNHAAGDGTPIRFTGTKTAAGPQVMVHYADSRALELPLHKGDKPHHHSPSGHSWGYGGSGPATLAESMLTELIGIGAPPGLYQQFKWERIAPVPAEDDWTITADEIRHWLHETTNARRGSVMAGFDTAAAIVVQPVSDS